MTIISLGDSTSVSALFNNGIRIKSTLVKTQVEAIKNLMTDLGAKFPNIEAKLSWLPGKENPADLVSKIFEAPLDIVNSSLYREGPEMYQSVDKMTKNTFLSYTHGEFSFTPLKDSILGITNRKPAQPEIQTNKPVIIEPDQYFVEDESFERSFIARDEDYKPNKKGQSG